MAENKKFLDGEGLRTFLNKLYSLFSTKAEIQEMSEDVQECVWKADRIDEMATTIRGRSLLTITTAPTSDPTPNYHYKKAVDEIKAEARVSEVFLGDSLNYEGTVYTIVTFISEATVGLEATGSVRGPVGPQGIQGIQGAQGPKGDPGEGYFIVTDEDYAKIADMIEEKSYHAYDRADASEPIRPNIFYRFGYQYELEITFADPSTEYRSNEYMFEFESPADRPTTLIMPADVKWCYDPVIEAGKKYQVSVLNNLAVICGA